MIVNNTFKSKLKTYFIKRLGAWDYRHGWMRLPTCPYCGREEKMGVNLSSYRCNCFRCGAIPNPAQLVMDVEHLETYAELTNYLNNEDFTEYTFKEEKVELASPKPVYLPDGFRLITQGNSQVAKSIRNYLIRRGFDINVLEKLGVGYCDSGATFGYTILPFYSEGKLRYYNARLVIGNGPRYMNPDKDITGLGKEFIIYNEDALDMYNTVYLCEGVFNALTMGERGIATMGKSVSRYQINRIIKAPVKRVIILLDPDAKDKAIDLGLKLINFKQVKVVYLPDGEDTNSLGKSKTMKFIYKTRYQTYSDLIRLKNEL